jgi:ribosomal protein S18 acetylase RimI-like enzyme
VELSVIADNERAVRLYERAGLRVVDHRMGRPL